MARQKFTWRIWTVGLVLILGAITAFGAASPMTGTTQGVASGTLVFGGITCNVVISGENSQDNAIQAALDSAVPGSVICVQPGVYPEQLTIHVPVHLVGCTLLKLDSAKCDLSGSGPHGSKVVIEPSSLVLDTFDYDSGIPNAPVIWVNTSGSGSTLPTVIEGLTVNGSLAASSWTFGCDNFFGIYYQNSSGTIRDVTVTGMHFPTSLLGCQGQNAIYVNNGALGRGGMATSVHVNILNDLVTGYGKNGITCNDPGVFCRIAKNRVQGLGPTPLIAQNGIQIGFGAAGIVRGNVVFGNSYNNTSDTENYLTATYMAGGILIYDASSATVDYNTVSANDIGIWVASGFYDVPPYQISPPVPATMSVALVGDHVGKNFGYGVVFDTTNGTVSGSTISDNPVGLFAVTFGNFNTTVIAMNDVFNADIVSTQVPFPPPNPPYTATIIVE